MISAPCFRLGRAVEGLAQAHAIEGRHAVGQERLADVKAREFFALEDDDAASGLGEQAGGGAAGGAATDNRDVVDSCMGSRESTRGEAGLNGTCE